MKTVNYSIVARKKPGDQEGEAKFYATAQAKGSTTLDEIAERISKSTTVTRADCLAVLAALEDEIGISLQSGEIVKLGDIGTFRVSISSTGAIAAEEFNQAMIKKPKIVFRPSTKLQNLMSTLTYVRVEPKPKKEE